MNDTLLAALIGGVAAIVGGLVSGGALWLLDWWTRPTLNIAVKHTADHIDHADYTDINGVPRSCIYVRAKVTSTGARSAQKCRVYMTSIQEVHPGHPETTPTVLADTKIVAWAGTDFEPRDIPQGVDFYVDVVRFDKNNLDTSWHFSLKPDLFSSQIKLRDFKGRYRFHLMVIGENARASACSLDVEYHGDWQTAVRPFNKPGSGASTPN